MSESSRSRSVARALRGSRRSAVGVATAGIFALAVVPPAYATAATGPLTASETVEQLAPGVKLRTLRPLLTPGFTNASVLEVKMGEQGARLDLMTDANVAFKPTGNNMTPGALAQARGAIGAINADGYDNGNTFAPNHTQILGGTLRTSGNPTDPALWPTLGVTSDGLGAVQRLLFDGKVMHTPTGGSAAEIKLDGLNTYGAIAANGITAYTPLWSNTTRSRTGGTNVTEVRVVDNVVAQVRQGTPGSNQVAANEFYLVGRETGGTKLQQLAVGDRVTLDYKLRQQGGGAAPDFDFALGGHGIAVPLVTDGTVTAVADTAGQANRTAIGFSADGRTAYLAAVTPTDLVDLGGFMRDLGAANAINVGGGGSTTLSARSAGATNVLLRTASQRNENAAIGVFTNPTDGVATTLRPRPVGGGPARVFAGGRLPLEAQALDAGWGPATPAEPVRWSSSSGTINAAGELVAPTTAGRVTVSATAGGASGSADVQVLGDMQSLAVTQDKVSFVSANAGPATIGLNGLDVEGFSAPVDAATVRLQYDAAVVRVEVQPDGRLQIAPVANGATVLWITDGDATTNVAIRVGSASLPTVVPGDPVADRLVSRNGSEAGGDWSFATLASLGITEADSADAARAVHTARATRPDFVLLDGVTADGTTAQVAAARSALEAAGCELLDGDTGLPGGTPSGNTVPCIAVPGVDDRAAGSVAAFEAGLGPASRSFVHRGVRFVLLDSSGPQLRANRAQLLTLRTALADAAADGQTKAVTVVTARPTSDPHGEAARAITDSSEVALLTSMLKAFREQSGKPATLVNGESRSASVRRDAGLTEVGVPPVGGEPRGGEAAGGFKGWTRFAVDGSRVERGLDALRADVRPVGSRAEVEAAASVAVDDTVAVDATVSQGARTVPLRYPATPRWSGSTGLAIGSGAAAIDTARSAGKTAIFDPTTRKLTGLKAGNVTLTVTADGQNGDAAITADATIAVTAPDVPDPGDGGTVDPGPGAPGPGAPFVPTPSILAPGPAQPTTLTTTAKLSPKAVRSGSGIKLTLSVAKGATATARISATSRLRVTTGKGRKRRTRTTDVAVAKSSRVTLADGARRSYQLKLNATGKAQLARTGRLTVRVTVTAKNEAGRSVATSKTVKLTAKKRR